ncbi:MAG: hypothetical protein Q4A63_07085 [Butyricicoccus pullicaecorum]|nr:hypothetical protein [Butyricicoccus pullicaecorum]
MNPTFNYSVDNVDNIGVTVIEIEQLADILELLYMRYFEDRLTNTVSERVFIDSHSRIGNIILHVETQLTEYVKRLEQAVQQIYSAEESRI